MSHVLGCTVTLLSCLVAICVLEINIHRPCSPLACSITANWWMNVPMTAPAPHMRLTARASLQGRKKTELPLDATHNRLWCSGGIDCPSSHPPLLACCTSHPTSQVIAPPKAAVPLPSTADPDSSPEHAISDPRSWLRCCS